MYDPQLWPERRVKVMCDFCSAPTWTAEGFPEDPRSLPISDALVADLRAWHDRYNAQASYVEDGATDPNALTAAWHAEGQRLACRLRMELPAGWEVVYHDEEALWRSLQTGDLDVATTRVVTFEEARAVLGATATP